MVMPGLEVGTARLNIEWINRDGSRDATTIGPYAVVAGPNALESPAFTHGTVRNGETDVDPAPINANGLLFVFNEPVMGAIKLTDEACAELNWTGTVDDRTASTHPGLQDRNLSITQSTRLKLMSKMAEVIDLEQQLLSLPNPSDISALRKD